jgi:2-oxoglutarate ferredoxin oxidoreductase subunit gamma
VIVAAEPIGSPVIDRADAVVALNPPSLARFEATVAPGGLLVLNTSLIEALPSRTDIEVVAVPCTALARTAGDDKLVSVVALGALLARRPIVPLAALRRALEVVLLAKRPEILAADLAALEAGYAAALDGALAPA